MLGRYESKLISPKNYSCKPPDIEIHQHLSCIFEDRNELLESYMRSFDAFHAEIA
jgi:hypothetical protein